MLFEVKGIEKISKRLSRLSENARNLDGRNQVSFAELFTRDFMMKYTSFTSFEQLLESGNFVVNSLEDFEDIPDDVFDRHIRSVTKFSSWQEMLIKASEEWVKEKLFE
jgi:hypothetical protein